VLLVCGAGTIAAHAGKYSAADAGFDSDRVVRGWLSIAKYPDAPSQARLFDDVLTRLRAQPLVAGAGIVDLHPGLAVGATPSVLVDGDEMPAKVQDLRPAAVRVASEGYLETLGLRPLSGRFFGATEGPPVAVVNHAFVKAHLGDRDPLGASVRVTLDGLPDLDPQYRTIIGVVPDMKEDVLHKPAPPTVYLPLSQRQTAESAVAIVVRPVSESPQLATIIREAVALASPGTAVIGSVLTISDLMEGEYARTRMSLRLVGVLAAVALVLAVVGVYGVTAHGVQHRVREIGIRLALGVAPSAIRRMILSEGATLLTIGIAIGGGLAFWLSPVVRSLVVGLDQIEVVGPLAGAALVLTLAVWAGCDIPARRAARVDPASALR
jgi:putative ABC transport system permease protein